MIKKKYYSAYHDFRTGFLYKIFILFGLILLFIYIILKIISFVFNNQSNGLINEIYNFSISNTTGTIIAFSILLLAIGIIIYFFHLQFSKLAKIAEEIETESKDLK